MTLLSSSLLSLEGWEGRALGTSGEVSREGAGEGAGAPGAEEELRETGEVGGAVVRQAPRASPHTYLLTLIAFGPHDNT